MKILIDSPWDHRYFEDEGKYYLEVLCGTVAIFDIAFALTPEEIENARVNEHFIAFLSKDVQNYPEKYRDRSSKAISEKIKNRSVKQ